MPDHARDNPEADIPASYWRLSGCAEYALAMHDLYPRLRFGRHVETYPEDADEDYIPWATNHVFVHDDNWAYDSLGRHALPYLDPDPSWAAEPANVSTEYDLLRADIESEWEIDEDLVIAARMRLAQADPVTGPAASHHPMMRSPTVPLALHRPT